MTEDAATNSTSMTRFWIGAGLVAALLLAVVPILSHPHLPLIDLPNHIARHYIAANPGTALDAYYSYAFAAKGNSAGDLLWLAGGRFLFDAHSFSSILMALYAANFVLASLVLGRVFHGRWTPWPLATVLVVYNTPFFWGFQNFLVTVPLALYALAAWIWFESVRPWLRALVFMPVGVALYQLHILGFVVLMVGVFGREVHRLILSGADWPRYLLTHSVAALPFLVPLGVTLSTMLTAAPNAYGDNTRYGTLSERIDMLTSPVAAVSVDAPMGLVGTGVLAILAIGAALLTLRRTSGPRLVLAPNAVGPIIALAVLCLAVPVVLDGVALVQIRFPFVVVAVAIAGTHWRGTEPNHAVAIALIFGALAVGRSATVQNYAESHSADVADLASVLAPLPTGARLLPVRMTPVFQPSTDWHLQAHAVPFSQAFVPTLFRGAHALKVNPNWLHLTAAQGMSIPARYVLGADPVPSERVQGFWPDGIASYTHLLALDPLPHELIGGNLRLLSSNGRFAVYTISDPP